MDSLLSAWFDDHDDDPYRVFQSYVQSKLSFTKLSLALDMK